MNISQKQASPVDSGTSGHPYQQEASEHSVAIAQRCKVISVDLLHWLFLAVRKGSTDVLCISASRY